jgi:NADH-quinone oxidoreductase subunit G
MLVANGMNIHTNTPMVKKAREGVMEFLLINHPLDCPVCDQGGECDLQDQAFKYGKNVSKFHEPKRAVKDKNMGPLISTHMTRCIHCTRCIRFSQDIAGIDEIGTIGRGENMEVVTYLESAITSELSGNLVDICPVGALTAKPYEFRYRSWELTKTDSIDVFDAMGSSVRIDSKGSQTIRILPKSNEAINQEWLSDKGRFSYDGLRYQRLDSAYVKINGKLEPVETSKALQILAEQIKGLKPEEIGAVCSGIIDCESIYAFKTLLQQIGCDNLGTNNYCFDVTARGNYLFNTTFAGSDDADLCLMVGADLKTSAPVLGARIGSRVRQGSLRVMRIGDSIDQTYPIEELGNKLEVLQQLVNNQHPACSLLQASKKPMIIIGDQVYLRSDSRQIMALCYQLAEQYGFLQEGWNGFNVLHNDASSVGLLDVGFRPSGKGKNLAAMLKAVKDSDIKMMLVVNADYFDSQDLQGAFVVYQVHHGDK